MAKILIADDAAFMRMMIKDILKKPAMKKFMRLKTEKKRSVYIKMSDQI